MISLPSNQLATTATSGRDHRCFLSQCRQQDSIELNGTAAGIVTREEEEEEEEEKEATAYPQANLPRGKPSSPSRGPVAGWLCAVGEDYTHTLQDLTWC